jgi:Domain of unknown function (DUF6434)
LHPRDTLSFGGNMPPFDWHSDRITRATEITVSYRNTQNVRRFFQAECGHQFSFDRSFMAWLKDGSRKTMGDAADEWLKRAAKRIPFDDKPPID